MTSSVNTIRTQTNRVEEKNHAESDFPERLRSLRKSLGLTQSEMAARLGLSMSYVHQLEKKKRTASEQVETLVSMLEAQLEAGLLKAPEKHVVQEESGSYRTGNRRIPVVGWAHAGEATDYDALPKGWQDKIPTDCRDPHAFAVRLEGESMMPRFEQGDLLILMPEAEVYSGCLAVVRLASGGVLFRRVEIREDLFILIPLNAQFSREEIPRSQIAWAFPVWGSWRQLWNR